jgi:DNA modification methylase
MKQKPTDYRNRIKALEYVDAANLTAHPGNWREHPQAQAEAMRGVLAEVGIAGALLAYRSERQGGALVVIDGHLRKDAAPQKWPVLILDVDDAEADYLLAVVDPLAAMAVADAGALDALLSSVQSGEAGVQAMLAELAEGAGLYQPQDDPQDAEPQIDRAEELRVKWGVESGQLWRLPSRTPGQEHRLICGDCTDAATVAQVLQGEVPLLMVTDPPYGIEHDTSWREQAGISTMGEQSAKGIEWDSNDDWSGAYAISGAQIAFVWHASSHNVVVARSLVDAGYDVKQMLIWNKSVAPFGRSHYSYKHEPCWYAVRRGKTANWKGPNNEVTVWDTASPRHIMGGSDEQKTPHPTQKPIMLYERPIANHTSLGDIVYEPFSGSGTALIAAENLSRQCRAVEISPGYVAVALQRYLDAFGIRGELAG